MKALVFGASNSKNSINQKLALYSAKQISGVEINLIDLNDLEMPIFSEDREKELGSPEQAQTFYNAIGEADVLVVSYAEHNGSYTAAYKNLFDWTSRIDMKVFQNKPMLLLSTSPGPGGAKNVLSTAESSAPYFAGEVKAAISLPSFYDNYDAASDSVSNQEFNTKLEHAIASL